MIDMYDVMRVADSINVTLAPEEVAEVIVRYPSAELDDPTATWDLIVEQLIWEVLK